MKSIPFTAKALLLSRALMSNAFYVQISPDTTRVDFYQQCGMCTFSIGQAKSAEQFVDKTNDIRSLPVSSRYDYDECELGNPGENVWYCYSNDSPFKYCDENRDRCTIEFQGTWGPSPTTIT